MRIYTFNSDGPSLLTLEQALVPSGPRMAWAEGPPAEGYWKVGDRVYSDSPANPGDLWVCIAEGEPGTWVLSGSSPSLGQGPIAGAYAGSNPGGADFINQQFGGMIISLHPGGSNQYEMTWDDVAPGRYLVALTSGGLGGTHVASLSNLYQDGRCVVSLNGISGVGVEGDFFILVFLKP